MDSNFRCPITPPQHDWWRLHINVSIVPTRTKTCLQTSFKNRRSDTNKIVTPRPGEVDTCQPLRALKWGPVSLGSIQGLARLMISQLNNKTVYYLRCQSIYKYTNFCRKFGRTPFKIQVTPCSRKIV